MFTFYNIHLLRQTFLSFLGSIEDSTSSYTRGRGDHMPSLYRQHYFT